MAFSERCREAILSEDYLDLITLEHSLRQLTGGASREICTQQVNEEIRILYWNRREAPAFYSGRYVYENIPKLYVPMSVAALEESGILQAVDQPFLNLQGQGVLLAFAETGIDYTHPAFLDENGRSRILRLWDQTIQTGLPPEGMDYGTEFTKEDLDGALNSEAPLQVVPSVDTNGHGTYTAGVAAGSRRIVEGERYQGAAPLAELAVVKLKPAKQYLRDYYQIPEGAVVYQETDILLAMRYFLEVQKKLERPMVVCFTMGSNLGGHDGESVLGFLMDQIARGYQTALVVAAGNEAARSHHFYGTTYSGEIPAVVELQVAEEETGFVMEIWPNPSELVTLAVVSPSGQQSERFITRLGEQNRFPFLLENTSLEVNFWYEAAGNANQIITLRFRRPAAGIWRILVYSLLQYQGGFHIWLPSNGLIQSETIFLKPEVEVTLTDPSAGEHFITVGAYQPISSSIYLQSGRGKTRIGNQQPTIAAPGIAVDGPVSGGVTGYERRTGTSAAAAITAGAAASLFTWGIVRRNLPEMTGAVVKFFLTIGAERQRNRTYPNTEWGYGTLNLYQLFEMLTKLQ